MRMAIEVLRAVRNQVGARFSGDLSAQCAMSMWKGGLRLEESKEIAKVLERNGADALHISACVPARGI